MTFRSFLGEERQEIQKYYFSNSKLIVRQAIRHLAFILCLLHWNDIELIL